MSPAPPRILTPRQRQIARLVAAGYGDKEIASIVGTSSSAVAAHLRRARRRLGCESTMELVTAVRRADARAPSPANDDDPLAVLTAAEREVALLAVEGLSNGCIARRRGTSKRTVANQVQAIFRKLEVRCRRQLAARLAARGPHRCGSSEPGSTSDTST